MKNVIATVEVIEEVSFAGGGSLPTQELKTFAVRWQPSNMSAESAARALRRADPPIVARIHKARSSSTAARFAMRTSKTFPRL